MDSKYIKWKQKKIQPKQQIKCDTINLLILYGMQPILKFVCSPIEKYIFITKNILLLFSIKKRVYIFKHNN